MTGRMGPKKFPDGARGSPPGIKKVEGSGRAKGVPNKATHNARQAIAMFVDNNAERLQEWLDQVAKGTPMLDAKGKQIFDDKGKPVFQIAPNAEKAFGLFQSVIEYHVPKLARGEVTGLNGGPIQTANIDLRGLSSEELETMQGLMIKANQQP